MFGLGGLFLLISPKLRGNVQDAIGSVYAGFLSYAPYSYVLGVLLVIAAVMTSFYRGSQAR